MTMSSAVNPITLFMCGDVMTGRGLDQILPHPVDPEIYESYLKSARGYVELAEQANGPIEQPVDWAYIWGDAIAEWERAAPDVRIANLETSVTRSDNYWEGKGIHYRMHPLNIPCLVAAQIDVCTLANNHVLDWGYDGLTETVETLDKVRIDSAGAGKDLAQAKAPAIVDVPGKGRVIVFSYGLGTSGIPAAWAATADRPGVNLLPGLSDESVRRVQQDVASVKQAGDVVVFSIHWGGNWGYAIPDEQVAFAHKLIDEAGVDVIHGHSSHHVKGFEVYRDKLVVYGAGDFINDYEGIGGYEAFRADLALVCFAEIDPATGRLVSLHMTPMQVRAMRLNRPSRADARWLSSLLTREGKRFGTQAEMEQDGRLVLRWD